jgi:hypothetical protein
MDSFYSVRQDYNIQINPVPKAAIKRSIDLPSIKSITELKVYEMHDIKKRLQCSSVMSKPNERITQLLTLSEEMKSPTFVPNSLRAWVESPIPQMPQLAMEQLCKIRPTKLSFRNRKQMRYAQQQTLEPATKKNPYPVDLVKSLNEGMASYSNRFIKEQKAVFQNERIARLMKEQRQ